MLALGAGDSLGPAPPTPMLVPAAPCLLARTLAALCLFLKHGWICAGPTEGTGSIRHRKIILILGAGLVSC